MWSGGARDVVEREGGVRVGGETGQQPEAVAGLWDHQRLPAAAVARRVGWDSGVGGAHRVVDSLQ